MSERAEDHDTYDPVRRVMAQIELQRHHVRNWGRNYSESDDGYSDMEAEERRGWHATAGWGRDGWDLGDWPYVMLYIRRHDSTKCDPICVLAGPRGSDFCPAWELLVIVEGDRSHYAFGSSIDLRAAVDYLFLWHAAGQPWSPVTYENRSLLEAGTLLVERRFRGPYGSHRHR